MLLAMLFKSVEVFSQCTCTNGAAIGGMTPISGTGNIGVLQKKNLNVNYFLSYGGGDDYYEGHKKIEDIDVKQIKFAYSSLVAGYGITDKFTVELETGFFLDKRQDFIDTIYHGRGFSHFGASVKYNFLHSIARELEFTAGLFGRAPMQFTDENLPQNILPSNGDFGGGVILFFHKGFSEQKSKLVLINRSGFSTENGINYKYGNYYYTSIYYIQSFLKDFAFFAELRNEIRQKDEYENNVFQDSGGYAFYFTPQINYAFRNWNFSLLGDIPMYQYYHGKQIGKQFSIAININWEYSFDSSDREDENDENEMYDEIHDE